MNIMVCHDGSGRAHKALEKTVAYFKAQKPDIMLLTVAEAPLDASIENEEIFEKWKGERYDVLREEASWVADHGLEVDAILAVGDPRTMILEAINKKSPDLVVVSRRGRSEIGRMRLGSVSSYLVHHSERPVLVMTLKKGD